MQLSTTSRLSLGAARRETFHAPISTASIAFMGTCSANHVPQPCGPFHPERFKLNQKVFNFGIPSLISKYLFKILFDFEGFMV